MKQSTEDRPSVAFGEEVLRIDAPAESTRIENALRDALRTFKRRGLVVAISGGIDSSVVLGLAVRALGADRVCALMLPEQDSSPETRRLSLLVAESFGVEPVEENITAVLTAYGCYERRNAAVRTVIPSFSDDHTMKIVLPSVVESDRYRVFSVVTESPDGKRTEARLPPDAYLGIVAASNFKQRVRKTFEYYYADKLNYAVAGTPNKLEYDQGFFVKNGDGSADVKPIAHLYKSQVYQLAGHLGVPQEIISRPPTTDTYSMPQSQEEFYFSLPYDKMDLCLYARENGVETETVASALGLTGEQVERVLRDIDQKRKTTAYLHTAPVVLSTQGLE